MSVTMCVFCDSMVDLDYNETCPGCERCPCGEYMFCGTCAFYKEPTSELLSAKTGDKGFCTNPVKQEERTDYDTESCSEYEDAEY